MRPRSRWLSSLAVSGSYIWIYGGRCGDVGIADHPDDMQQAMIAASDFGNGDDSPFSQPVR